MSRLVHDVRVAARTLARSPWLTMLAIGAFALGIGVTTAVFGIFHGVLIRPLPFPDADEIVMVYDTQPACDTCPASLPKYEDWRERNQVFATMGGFTTRTFVLTGRGEADRVAAVRATASLVDVFGLQPALGRWFTEEEDREGAGKVAVLLHSFWVNRLARDPGVLGRTLTLDGEPYEIVGVMPEGFTLRSAELVVPLAQAVDPATRGSHFLFTFARLKPGVPLDRATTEMRALGRTLAAEFGTNHGVDVRSYREAVVGQIRTSLQVLLGAVFLLLLIACANVANLLLAAGLARRRELGVRLALGARPGDLARQLAAESVLLAIAGGALGVLVARWIVQTFVVLAADQLPRAAAITIDAPVVAFAFATSLVVGVLCGLWPLVSLRAGELVTAVRDGDTRTGTGAGRRVGNGLVVAEIALAFSLLVGASLMMKNLILLQGRDTGLRAQQVVTFDVAPAGPRYQTAGQLKAFYRDLQTRLANAGGFERVGFVSHLPMLRFGYNGEMNVEGGTPWGPDEAPLVEYRWVHGDYFEALGIPLLHGRWLDARDGEGTTTVLVNQQMAAKFWPGQDPIGRRFGQGADTSRWYEVVGVVGDVRSYGLAATTPYEFYRTIEQQPFPAMSVVARTTAADPTSVVPTARAILRQIDPALPLTGVQTMEAVVAASVGRPRFLSALTALFGLLAGLLAMVGVYGVMAYNVRRQRREYGIRLALGAGPGAVVRLVLGRGLGLATLGLGLGATGAWWLAGLLESMLHEVEPTDPQVFAATAAGVVGVVLLASYLPARSAARIDPMQVLRDG
jgi:putative ABC transport system permease protein